MKVGLSDWIIKGKFGEISLGMSRDQIVSLLGQPTVVLGDADSHTSTYKYGDVDFVFAHYRLKMIRTHKVLDLNGGDSIQLVNDLYESRKAPHLPHIIYQLLLAGGEFLLEKPLKDYILIKTAPGCNLTFENFHGGKQESSGDIPEDYYLTSIYYKEEK